MTEPYPEPSGISGITDILKYANSAVDGYYSLGAILVIWIILFAVTKNKGYPMSLSGMLASSITFVLSGFLWLLEIVPGRYMVVQLALLVVFAIWAAIESR